ncbi:hypothetical protein ACLOJK_037490 [Asimina triloba]
MFPLPPFLAPLDLLWVVCDGTLRAANLFAERGLFEASSSGTVCGKDIALIINDLVFIFSITMPPMKVPRAISSLAITAAITVSEPPSAARRDPRRCPMRHEGLDVCQRHMAPATVPTTLKHHQEILRTPTPKGGLRK